MPTSDTILYDHLLFRLAEQYAYTHPSRVETLVGLLDVSSPVFEDILRLVPYNHYKGGRAEKVGMFIEKWQGDDRQVLKGTILEEAQMLLHLLRSEPQDAVAIGQELLAHSFDSRNVEMGLRSLYAIALQDAGRHQAALNELRITREFHSEQGNTFSTMRALGNEAVTLCLTGDLKEAVSRSEQALSLGAEAGDVVATALFQSNLGFYYFLLGEFDIAKRFAELSYQAHEKLRLEMRKHNSGVLIAMAMVAKNVGDGLGAEFVVEESARDLFSRAHELMQPAYDLLLEYRMLRYIPFLACASLVEYVLENDSMAQKVSGMALELMQEEESPPEFWANVLKRYVRMAEFVQKREPVIRKWA